MAVDTVNAAPWRRLLFALNALVAWSGLALSFTLTVLGTYPSQNTDPTMLGNPDQGAIGRILDFFTYFTIWSNIIVAIVMTMLAINPTRNTFWFRVVRLDALLMITVTGIIYNAILAASAKNEGLEVISNFLEHVATPALTFAIWLVAGPRGWINWRTIWAALIIPVVWLVWALARGAVIDAYPYGFLNVAAYGYPTVLLNVLYIIIMAIILCLIFWGLDWVVRKMVPEKQTEAA
jgi:hypothetical protein